MPLERVEQLGRALLEGVVPQHDFPAACCAVAGGGRIGERRVDDRFELLNLALTQIGGHIRRLAPLRQTADDAGTSRLGQTADFVERIVADGLSGKNYANEDRLFARDAVNALVFVQFLCGVPRVV